VFSLPFYGSPALMLPPLPLPFDVPLPLGPPVHEVEVYRRGPHRALPGVSWCSKNPNRRPSLWHPQQDRLHPQSAALQMFAMARTRPLDSAHWVVSTRWDSRPDYRSLLGSIVAGLTAG